MLTRILALAALCASLGLAGDDTASIAGQVLNSVTQAPVKGARVYLRRAGRDKVAYAAVTSAEGRFAVNDIAPGGYRLDAECDGYAGRTAGRGRRKTLVLGAGQIEKELTIRIVPLGAISGRVLDESGMPKAGAQVTLLVLRNSEEDGATTALLAGMVQSNDLGEYRLHGLNSDRYVLCAEQRTKPIDWDANARPASSAPQPVYLCSYWSDAISPARATPIDLAPGANLTGIDMSMHPCPQVNVRGRVVPAPGKAGIRAAAADMIAPASFMLHNHESKLDAEGRFSFSSVAPGIYYLTAAYVAGEVRHQGRLKLDVGADPIDDLQVAVSPYRHFSVVFVSERSAKIDYSRVGLSLPRQDSSWNTLMNRDGTFVTQRGIESGVYPWRVTGLPNNMYVKTAKLGDSDVTHSDLDLSQPVAAKLEFTLSPDGGEVQGIVTDEKSEPVEEATVVLIPSGEQRGRIRLYQNTESDWQGRFAIYGIAPGDYKLFAWEQVKSGRWYDAAFMKPLESSGVEISIREKATETRTLKAIPAETAR
jgi:hypothetical protein